MQYQKIEIILYIKYWILMIQVILVTLFPNYKRRLFGKGLQTLSEQIVKQSEKEMIIKLFSNECDEFEIKKDASYYLYFDRENNDVFYKDDDVNVLEK